MIVFGATVRMNFKMLKENAHLARGVAEKNKTD
jgi:hypothetical protein